MRSRSKDFTFGVSRGVLSTLAIGATGLFLGCPPPAVAPNKDVACFKQFTGVPYNDAAPAVDGILAGDLGWTNAFRYVRGNGSSVPDMAFQAIRDDVGKFLYLGFEVHNDSKFDDQDAILLTFSPGSATNDRRILIFPLYDGTGAAPSGAPRDIQYWLNSGTWNTTGAPTPTATPNWLSSNIKATSDASTGSWFVEVKIPIVAGPSDPGINLPSGQFPFHVNVFRWYYSPPTINAAEFPWPAGAGLVGGQYSEVTTSTPAPSAWGQGNLTDQNLCNGVSFDWYDIAVRHPASSTLGWLQIAWNQTNDFTVTPRNDAVDANNQYMISPKVFAKFKIANWGIPSLQSWNPVAVPTASGTTTETPPRDIPAATLAGADQGWDKLVLGPWSVAPADIPKYQANPKQCVLVELDSKASGVTFKNRSAWTNMHFVAASSPFSDTASIGLRGLKPPEGKDSVEMLLSAHTYNTPPEMRWETRLDGVTEIVPNRVFRLQAKGERDVPLPSVVLPPRVAIPSSDYQLPSNLGIPGGSPLALAVRGDNLITLLAEGSIQVRNRGPDGKPLRSSPAGVDLRPKTDGSGQVPDTGPRPTVPGDTGVLNRRSDGSSLGTQYRLLASLNPAAHVGAVIASWDGFRESSFLVGAGATLKVPRDARQLFIAINDTPEGFREHSGGEYHLQVIQTPLEKHFGVSHPEVGGDPRYDMAPIPLGSNLPTWIMCGQVPTGRKISVGGVTGDLIETVSCYGSMVTRNSIQ